MKNKFKEERMKKIIEAAKKLEAAKLKKEKRPCEVEGCILQQNEDGDLVLDESTVITKEAAEEMVKDFNVKQVDVSPLTWGTIFGGIRVKFDPRVPPNYIKMNNTIFKLVNMGGK